MKNARDPGWIIPLDEDLAYEQYRSGLASVVRAHYGKFSLLGTALGLSRVVADAVVQEAELYICAREAREAAGIGEKMNGMTHKVRLVTILSEATATDLARQREKEAALRAEQAAERAKAEEWHENRYHKYPKPHEIVRKPIPRKAKPEHPRAWTGTFGPKRPRVRAPQKKL